MKLIVDGTNLTHRYWHASGKDPDRAGAGVVGVVARAAREVGATSALVAFDGAGASDARRAMYPEYKATRNTSNEVDAALTAAKAALGGAGWTVFTQDGVEADDVLAALASGPTCLLTSDKDAWSLISDEVVVWRPANPFDVVDVTYVQNKLGFGPDKYLLYACAKGDSSDNIAGLPGIGEVSAAKLAVAFTFDEVLADIASGAALISGVLAGRAKGIKADLDGAATILERNKKLMSGMAVHGAAPGPVPASTESRRNSSPATTPAVTTPAVTDAAVTDAAVNVEPTADVTAMVAAVRGDWW